MSEDEFLRLVGVLMVAWVVGSGVGLLIAVVVIRHLVDRR